MRSAFSLLELVFAVAMSAMLATILYNSFNQSNISLSITSEYKDVDTNEVIVIHQMEQDLAGAIWIEQEKEKKPDAAQSSPASSNITAPGALPDKAKDIKPLTKNFVYIPKNNRLQLFTFFTLNPRALHNGKPRLVRVVYRLKEHKEKKDTFILTRQETENLDFDIVEAAGEKRPRELVVTDAIERCSCDFIYTKSSQEEGSEKVTETIEKATEWDTDKNQKEEIAKNKKPPLPKAVNLTLVVWDETFSVKRSIVYQIPIYTYDAAREVDKKNGQAAPQQSSLQSQTQQTSRQQPQPSSQSQSSQSLHNRGQLAWPQTAMRMNSKGAKPPWMPGGNRPTSLSGLMGNKL